MGKPAAADLKLGLATAPVLFACEKVSVVDCAAIWWAWVYKRMHGISANSIAVML